MNVGKHNGDILCFMSVTVTTVLWVCVVSLSPNCHKMSPEFRRQCYTATQKKTKSTSACIFYSGIVQTVLPDRPAFHQHRSCVAVGVLCACATCPMCTAVSLSLCDWLKVHIFRFVFVVLTCTPQHTVNAHAIHRMVCLSTVTMSQCHIVHTGENTKEQETIIFTLFTLPDDLR